MGLSGEQSGVGGTMARGLGPLQVTNPGRPWSSQRAALSPPMRHRSRIHRERLTSLPHVQYPRVWLRDPRGARVSPVYQHSRSRLCRPPAEISIPISDTNCPHSIVSSSRSRFSGAPFSSLRANGPGARPDRLTLGVDQDSGLSANPVWPGSPAPPEAGLFRSCNPRAKTAGGPVWSAGGRVHTPGPCWFRVPGRSGRS